MLRPTARLGASFRRRPRKGALPSSTPPFSRRIAPQLAFTAGGISLALGSAAYLTNRDTLARSPSSALASDPAADEGRLFNAWRRRLTTGLSPSLARQRAEEAYARAGVFVRALPGNRLAVVAAENWLEIGEAKRTALGLIAGFAGVWVLWRLPARLGVGRWLAHDALSGKSVTMLTSTFSHRTIPHILFNSLALYSFTTATFQYLNTSDSLPRSTSRFEYLALFVSAGLVSAAASHVWFSRVVAGRILQAYGAKAARDAIVPSLGASGAVYALVTLTALSFPSTSISLIFLPFFPLPIGLATAGLLAVDVVGLVRGWRAFDHAAHLAGAASGAAYWAVGHDAFERIRKAMWPAQRRIEAEQRASRGFAAQ
ncbi:hypothetical protein JCM10450v2_003545 [Rhodotorula kratochvilovae]